MNIQKKLTLTLADIDNMLSVKDIINNGYIDLPLSLLLLEAMCNNLDLTDIDIIELDIE